MADVRRAHQYLAIAGENEAHLSSGSSDQRGPVTAVGEGGEVVAHGDEVAGGAVAGAVECAGDPLVVEGCGQIVDGGELERGACVLCEGGDESRTFTLGMV